MQSQTRPKVWLNTPRIRAGTHLVTVNSASQHPYPSSVTFIPTSTVHEVVHPHLHSRFPGLPTTGQKNPGDVGTAMYRSGGGSVVHDCRMSSLGSSMMHLLVIEGALCLPSHCSDVSFVVAYGLRGGLFLFLLEFPTSVCGSNSVCLNLGSLLAKSKEVRITVNKPTGTNESTSSWLGFAR